MKNVCSHFGLCPKRVGAADARAASTCSLEVLGDMLIGVEGVIVPK